jgi:hypothetical protein
LHRLDDQLTVFNDHHRGVLTGKYPRVTFLQFGAVEVLQLAAAPANLIGRNPLAFGRRLVVSVSSKRSASAKRVRYLKRSCSSFDVVRR